MDLRLPTLAAINLHLDAAAEAISESGWETARAQIEAAEIEIEKLAPERSEDNLIDALIQPLETRGRALRSKLPRKQTVRLGDAVVDPEQDEAPE